MAVGTWAREWEEYDGPPTEPASVRLHVTLNRRGLMLINKNVHEMMGRPEAVKLLFDRKNRTIGVRPATDADTRPFPVKAHPKGSHFYIQSAPFCRFYRAMPPRHIRFLSVRVDHQGILVLNMNDVEQVVPKPRSTDASNAV